VQREGVAKALAEGKYKGRAPTAQAKVEQMRALAAQGFNPTQIAKKLGVSRRSVYRVRDKAAPDLRHWPNVARG
jgi:DNA invertase Pin-like site-specific DNA recombinase